ncbi:hypothetical protein HZZ00_37655 (plasmid) [Streptomyces sp. NEAU-sy36]|uniref:hypothetical protein n=1 Tax=unclassified Streptomyces TaxID=2593676 RepID=UPI0015D5D6C5|nr:MULTISPECIES: hypothetical protein [unclassified Streptomyces]QLJ06759.1 hypothetical protein HZZ00_37655 [Streptomyces sp. NEAU-sy36]
MYIDPRLVAIDATADERHPTEVFEAQFTVVADNLFAGYLRDPQRTDAMLRRDGLTKTADRLVEVLGSRWWEDLPTEDGSENAQH